MIAEGVNPANLESPKASQLEILQTLPEGTQDLITESANPFQSLGRLVDTLGPNTVLLVAERYGGALPQHAGEEGEPNLETNALVDGLALGLAPFAESRPEETRELLDHILRGEADAPPAPDEQRRIAKNILNRIHEAVNDPDEYARSENFVRLRAAMAGYKSAEIKIRDTTDPYEYFLDKAKECTDDLTRHNLEQEERRLGRYPEKYDGRLWDSMRPNFRPKLHIDYTSLRQLPPDQMDAFDRALLVVNGEITVGRDVVSSLYRGENLGDLAGTDELKQPGMLDKAASTIRELVNIGLGKIGRWDARASSQLASAIGLMRTYTEREPNFNPYQSGLEEAYALLVSGVAAISVDFKREGHQPYAYPEKAAGLTTMYDLLGQLDEIQAIKLAQSRATPAPSEPVVSSPQEENHERQVETSQLGFRGDVESIQGRDQAGESLDTGPAEEMLIQAFAAPSLRDARTDEILRSMRKEGQEVIDSYFRGIDTDGNVPAEEIATRIVADVLELDQGGDVKFNFIKHLRDLCLGEDGVLDMARLGREAIGLREALAYIQSGNPDQIQQRLDFIFKTLEKRRNSEDGNL